MKLQIKVDDEGNIVDSCFKTFGCGSAIASSSVATEWVKGKSLDDVLTIKNSDIAKHLSLPPVKLHCSMLAGMGAQTLQHGGGGRGGGGCCLSICVRNGFSVSVQLQQVQSTSTGEGSQRNLDSAAAAVLRHRLLWGSACQCIQVLLVR